MNGMVHLRIDDVAVEVAEGASVAAAIARVTPRFRLSRSGRPRGPLCGMGVCFECRVTIGGEAHALACMTPVREGMQVRTGG